MKQAWSVEDARELYQVDLWGHDYFAIAANGHAVVRPDAAADREIDLFEVIEGLRERDISTPVLLRFSDLVAHRLRRLNTAFAAAIAENEYEGRYVAVYPIKVNQQRHVVEEVFRHGSPYGFGLEVGSKPELLAVMVMTDSGADRVIVCNGFKDDSYIEAVILATKLGRNIIPVVESFEELRLIIEHAERYDVQPRIGVRIKLSSQGSGRWRDSAGVKSKFGLHASELLEMLELLRSRDMASCLKLVHCHAGSQVQDIRRVKEAVSELTRVYVELHRLGAGLEYLDIGGGLGVDYDGSRTNFPSSMNYTLDEYASDVVYRVASMCNETETPHPTIITESGRAIAAFGSVLVFDVLGSAGPGRIRALGRPAPPQPSDEELPQPLLDLYDAHDSVTERRLLEAYHDALQAREQALNLFKLGYLSLELRGLADRVFWAVCFRIRAIASRMAELPEDLDDLEDILRDTYFCNFSVFQSLPDSWAIGQLFPLMPIHRLDEPPATQAVLGDITCDSDGRIDRFVDQRDVNRTLAVHELRPGERYYLATFLVGAYQETLGDLHNLFGDTHVVHIRLHEEGGWWIDEVVRGDTVSEVLSYMQYDVARLYPRLSRDCERAVREGRMTLAESRTLLRFYRSALHGYTYMEADG